MAVFPEELPRRLIRMFSFVGETVLDPFLGSGTTTLAAMKLGRNSIGYEVNPDFLPFIRKKTESAEPGLFDTTASTTVVTQDLGDIDFQADVERLPYVFHDPLKLDKKVDPRKLRFGSKINGKEDDHPPSPEPALSSSRTRRGTG